MAKAPARNGTAPSILTSEADAIATAADNAVGALESIEEDEDKFHVVLSSGIVLRIKPVPPLALRRAVTSVPPPAVPIVYIESKGREEPNPNDPDYLKAVQEYEQNQILRMTDVLFFLGTAIESIPDGLEGPEGDEWIAELEVLNLPVDKDNKYKRYLSWLTDYALMTERDIAKTVTKCLGVSGVTEVEVQRAVAAFRSAKER